MKWKQRKIKLKINTLQWNDEHLAGAHKRCCCRCYRFCCLWCAAARFVFLLFYVRECSSAFLFHFSFTSALVTIVAVIIWLLCEAKNISCVLVFFVILIQRAYVYLALFNKPTVVHTHNTFAFVVVASTASAVAIAIANASIHYKKWLILVTVFTRTHVEVTMPINTI